MLSVKRHLEFLLISLDFCKIDFVCLELWFLAICECLLYARLWAKHLASIVSFNIITLERRLLLFVCFKYEGFIQRGKGLPGRTQLMAVAGVQVQTVTRSQTHNCPWSLPSPGTSPESRADFKRIAPVSQLRRVWAKSPI